MRAVRTVLALALIAMGVLIVVRMLHFPFLASLTGFVLGGAMIALGTLRLRNLYRKPIA